LAFNLPILSVQLQKYFKVFDELNVSLVNGFMFKNVDYNFRIIPHLLPLMSLLMAK
jgi:hypothetical protein